MRVYKISLEILSQAIRDLGEKGGWWTEPNSIWLKPPIFELEELLKDLQKEFRDQNS